LNKPLEKGSNEKHYINYEAIAIIQLELMLLVPRRVQGASPALPSWVGSPGSLSEKPRE
jgi:hypothetical protein